MRKVFLDELPRKEGYDGKKIDWKKSIGGKFRFIYDDLDGEIEIVDYTPKGQRVTVKYIHGEIFKTRTSNITSCSLSAILGRYSGKFKSEIGQVFEDDKRDLVIIDREYKRKEYIQKNKIRTATWKYYKYRCNKCGYVGWILEAGLISKKIGCSCCYGRTAVLGINTIWDTDRWMVDLGVSEEDAKKYSKCSSKKITVYCTKCGNKKIIPISRIFTYKSICCLCGDGVSYPEKIMMSILNQVGIKFIPQLSKATFEWCDNRRYDFYFNLNNKEYIIEIHGLQHYSHTGFKRTIKEEQKNDKIKEELALRNGIYKYIVIDCRKSDLYWIKNNIINSELANILDLSKIDWEKCESFALRSLVKDVCDYWESRDLYESIKTVSDVWGLSVSTVRNYIKKGVILGWCSYSPKKERNKFCNKNKVQILNKFGVVLGEFESYAELERKSEELFGKRLLASKISEVCLGKRKSHKGFTFKYIDESQKIAS